MVYKRYVKRKGKLVGPYYYKTVKNKAGKTRTIYIGRTPPAEPKDESATTSPRYVSSFYSESISKLKKNILLCNAKKELLRLNLERLHLRYQNNEISYSKYELLKNSYLKGKGPEYWYNYYDDYQRNLQDHVDKYLFASSCFGYIQAVSKTGHEANEQLRPKPKLPHAYERKISYLQNNALLCDQRKTRLRKRLQEYSQRYSNRQISYSQYELLRNDYLKGKSPEYWFSYYDEQKLKLEEQISRYKIASVCEKYTAEIFEAKPSLKEKVLTDIVEEELELEEPKFYDKHKSLTQILAVSLILLILLPSLIFMIPAVKESYSERYDALTVTGFAVIDGVEDYANKGAGLAFDVLKSSFRFLRSFSPTGFAITTGLGNGSSSNYKLTFASIGSIGDSGSSSSYNVNVSGDAAWGTVMGNGSSSGYIIQLGYLKQPLNTAPTIIDISDVPAVTLSEGLVTPVEFSFVLDDQDGISDLVNESVEANFSKEGDTTRWNTTCLAVVEGTNATAQNYTCTIDMQYWDGAGTWTADVQGGDEEFNVSRQETFTVNTLTAVNISATTLSWAQLFVGSIDNMMSTAELNITNIGNQNLTNITLQGINLIGGATNTVWIPAANFTSSWGVRGCDAGAWLINDTDMQINSDSALDFGPGNLVTTNNATHVCMEEIGQDITQQSYSTAGDVEDWTITGGTGAI